jgi:hypothetical protein
MKLVISETLVISSGNYYQRHLAKSHQNNFYGVLKQQYAAISAAPPPSSSFGIELPTMQVPEPKLLSVGEALHTSSFIATQLKIGRGD